MGELRESSSYYFPVRFCSSLTLAWIELRGDSITYLCEQLAQAWQRSSRFWGCKHQRCEQECLDDGSKHGLALIFDIDFCYLEEAFDFKDACNVLEGFYGCI
jgi:hypothetical protein